MQALKLLLYSVFNNCTVRNIFICPFSVLFRLRRICILSSVGEYAVFILTAKAHFAIHFKKRPAEQSCGAVFILSESAAQKLCFKGIRR